MAKSALATRIATCACGKLSVTCIGEPSLVALCHCLECQKRTGSTYGVAAFFPRASIAASGAPQDFTRQGDSGSTVTFHFCPSCGATVYWEPQRRPDLIAVAVGAFADPTFPAPQYVTFEERRHDWVVGPG